MRWSSPTPFPDDGPVSAPPVTRPFAPHGRAPRLAVAAAGVTVLLWASAFVVIRVIGTDLGPGPMALGRVAVAALALTPFVVRRRGLRLPRGRTLALVVVYGVMWFAAYNVALNAAERSIDAGTAALVVNVAPILIAVGAAVLLKEGFSLPLLGGCVVALAGVALMSAGSGSGSSSGGDGEPVGLLLALLAAVLYAASVLIQKGLLGRIDALTVTWFGCVVGTVVLLPFAPALVAEAGRAPGSAVLGTVYLGLFPTAVAFTTWAYALTHVPAGRLGVIGYVVTVVAVLLSWALLDEVPTGLVLAGGALCLVGVAVSRLPGRRAHPG